MKDLIEELGLEAQARAFAARSKGTSYAAMVDSNACFSAAEEGLLEALQRVGMDRSPGEIRSYLITGAWNKMRDLVRKESRRPTLSIDNITTTATGTESPFTDRFSVDHPIPTEPTERKDVYYDIIEKLRAKLPDKQFALVMAIAEGMSYDEAAKATEMPLGTVKSTLSSARQKVADCPELTDFITMHLAREEAKNHGFSQRF